MNSQETKQEFYQRIKDNISILDYASTLGYHVVKKGTHYYSLKEHDSVIIDVNKNCFWRNSSSACGSVIDFALEFTTMSMSQVLTEFERILDGQIGLSSNYYSDMLPTFDDLKKIEFKLPDKTNNVKSIYAYLMNRGINKIIFAEFMNRHLLYQDTKNNCVFVAYNEKGVPVYAMLRGTNTYKTFKGDVQGSDYRYAFTVDYGGSRLIVCESPIEVMSLMSLFIIDGIPIKQFDWIAMSGIEKRDSLFYRLSKKGYQQVILALNNDYAGREAMDEIERKLTSENHRVLKRLPDENDWNDQLTKVGKLHNNWI